MGNYKPGSDIDLAIKGDNLRFDDLLQLHYYLEKLDMLYKFDMQLYHAIKDADMLDHIKRIGKEFYIKSD